MRNFTKVDKAWEDLHSNQSFKWDYFVKAIGWKDSTAKTYRSKKFKNIINLENKNNNTYKVTKLPPLECFRVIMQQTIPNDATHKIYLDKSIDIMFSAVGIFNNPNINYKADTAVCLIITAYIDLILASF